MKLGRLCALACGALLAFAGAAQGADSAFAFTAERPDCWLVLANSNSPESVEWAEFYRQARGVPEENIVWLDAVTTEHIPSVSDAHAQITQPVREYLATHPEIESRIVGIIVGFGVPGTFGRVPFAGAVSEFGGYSVASDLQDLNKDADPAAFSFDYNYAAAFFTGGVTQEPLSKADLLPGHYMTARIDAPSLGIAKRMTEHALAIEQSPRCLVNERAYCDWTDPQLPSGEWGHLKAAVSDPELSDMPWTLFDSNASPTPLASFRFGAWAISGWDLALDRLTPSPDGPRVLAFNLNSFGAVSVRDCSALVYGTLRGPYVPNVLVAGYAAGIGATAEPGTTGSAPSPRYLLQALRRGRTLGEAVYAANPLDNWVWTLVGDPLLRLPRWYGDDRCAGPLADVNGDGSVDAWDIAPFVEALTSPDDCDLTFGDGASSLADVNLDGRVNGYDIDPFIELLVAIN